MLKNFNLIGNLKSDLASGLVLYFVALPLCLGIALASGAPLFSGIISGIIGGIVVGFLSNSQLSVSGPAAGLTAIVLTAISDLGTFDIFLTAVFIAGLVQLILGFLKAGTISNFFPNNVIEGMLAGIGVIIILKQIPHFFGFSKDFQLSNFLFQDKNNSFLTLINTFFSYSKLGSVLIAVISLFILIAWDKIKFLKNLKLIPGAFAAVIVSIIINQIFINSGSNLALHGEYLVNLPIPKSFNEFQLSLPSPNIAGFANIKVWTAGLTIAIVASIETLLCIEASDRMDKLKRSTNTNTELKAQGIGNMLSALCGGLPMTSVALRTSANSCAGAKTKMSSIFHGILLLGSVLLIPVILNKIPLATLAGVLFLIGYKLAKPEKFTKFWHNGKYQFIPFFTTFAAVVCTDLLKGVALGIIISVLFILHGNVKKAYNIKREKSSTGDIIHINLAQEISFLNKAAIKKILKNIPENSKVIISAHDTVYMAHDILDLIYEFKNVRAVDCNITVELKSFKSVVEYRTIL